MDPARLAALMDGSLTGADRQAAIAEVAAFSADDLGVFAAAAAVLRKLEAEKSNDRRRKHGQDETA